VCIGCAVTERFALKTKYFYDEENLGAFREEYKEMSIPEKAMENRFLSVAILFLALVVVTGLGIAVV
jgi:restriction endonuclease Mrr